jgi:hypothetical protein
MGLLDAAGSGRRLAGGLGGELLARSFASGRLAGGLLRTTSGTVRVACSVTHFGASHAEGEGKKVSRAHRNQNNKDQKTGSGGCRSALGGCRGLLEVREGRGTGREKVRRSSFERWRADLL